jgi:hypothetical protein
MRDSIVTFLDSMIKERATKLKKAHDRKKKRKSNKNGRD